MAKTPVKIPKRKRREPPVICVIDNTKPAAFMHDRCIEFDMKDNK